MIPEPQLPVVCDAVNHLVSQYGHPDDIPLGSLARRGVEWSTAEQCELLLTESEYPSDASAAVEKWMRQIRELVRPS